MVKILSLIVAAFTFLVAGDAVAGICFDRAELMKHLDTKFSEAPVAAGLANNGSVIEVFASKEGNTFTIVLTQPNGATCVMASGEAWMGIKSPEAGKVSSLGDVLCPKVERRFS